MDSSNQYSPTIYPLNGLARIEQACECLGCSRTHLWRLANEGEVDRVNIGRGGGMRGGMRGARITWESLHAYIKRLRDGEPPVTLQD